MKNITQKETLEILTKKSRNLSKAIKELEKLGYEISDVQELTQAKDINKSILMGEQELDIYLYSSYIQLKNEERNTSVSIWLELVSKYKLPKTMEWGVAEISAQIYAGKLSEKKENMKVEFIQIEYTPQDIFMAVERKNFKNFYNDIEEIHDGNFTAKIDGF
jgi:hypothetical protein